MTLPPELRMLFALVAWVAILLPIAAWVDRSRERRRLRAIGRRGGRVLDEDDAVSMLANSKWAGDD